jgi:ubiquinone/menaquinone biosynthesis C-methylase UbiE
MSGERSYVIGTHDAEIARLGVQHQVWRSSVLDLWRLGGVDQGMTVIDAGAGPGYASVDLAEIVGPEGRVVALERSGRFLGALKETARVCAFSNIEAVETDLVEYSWPTGIADRVWCRWILTFVNDPARVLEGISRALKPGGKVIIQEYYDYGSWHLAPRSEAFEAYVQKIIARFRASGGDADIGLALPKLLPDAGLEIEFVRPVVLAARMNDFSRHWPMDFARQYIPVMAAEGDLTAAEASELGAVLDRYEQDPNALVIAPGLLQIVARKR